MNKRTIFTLELIGIIFVGLVGFLMILWASNISTYILPHFYDMDIRLQLNKGEIYRLNDFLLSYDFSRQEGNISFKISDNQNIGNIIIDYFSFLDNKTLKIKVFEIDESNKRKELENVSFKYDFQENPVNDPRYTTLVIDNYNEIDLSNKFIVIEFNSNIEPNGIFVIYHAGVPISSNEYSVDFRLGDRYKCPGECIDKDFNLNIKEYQLSSKQEIKLVFEDKEDQFHRFKIDTEKKSNVFLLNLLNGLGVSLLGSAIILLFKFWIESLKNKEKVCCPLCSSLFKNKRGLKVHIAKIH